MFHVMLHRFWGGHGMGTAALKEKRIQHITSMREVVLYKLFIDLQKA